MISYWLPFLTLLKKELYRFLAAFIQTVLAPLITAALYLFIFGYSLGSRIQIQSPVTFAQFVIPGLILMSVVQNAFQNTSSSLFFSRYIGNIIDFLVAPITPTQFIFAYTLAAMLRGLLVGFLVFLISIPFGHIGWPHPLYATMVVFIASFMFSQCGIIAGIYSGSWEQIAVYTHFLILPMVFLGGVFYPSVVLPPFWRKVSHLNPIYYLVDGMRWGMIGVHDSSPLFCLSISIGVSLVLFSWAALLIHRGYNLKS